MIFQMVHETNFRVCQVAHGSVAYLDKHSTLHPVMISLVTLIPTGGNFLKFFKPLDVNFGLKCKCDLIAKNSIEKNIANNHLKLKKVMFIHTV